MTGVPASSGRRRTSTLAKKASMSTCRTVHPSARSTTPPLLSNTCSTEEDYRLALAVQPRRDLRIIGTTPVDRRPDQRSETDMTTPPEDRDTGTPADAAEGTMPEGQYLGRDSGADLEADGGADGGADSGAGEDDPTTEADEDSRFA
jgi:hypothetical protein